MKKPRQTSRIRRWLTAGFMGICLLQVQTPSLADYSVQVGAFAGHKRAVRFATQLQNQGFPTATYKNVSGMKAITRVRVGPYPDKATAKAIRLKLNGMGIEGFLVKTPSAALTKPAATGDTPTVTTATPQDWPTEPGGIEGLFIASPQADGQNTVTAAQGYREGSRDKDRATGRTRDTAEYGFRGFFQSEYAYTYPSPGHSSKFRNILHLATSGRLNKSTTWKISARGAYDAVFDLDDFYPGPVEDDRQFDGMLHETYLDIDAGDWDFRLGRQHIIWGEMIGLFYADVVSARDMRQFVAQDFDLIRIPQWAARAEYFKGDFHTEAIWIPYMSYDDIGEPGDDFYPLRFTPPAGFDLIIENDTEPAQKLSNSAYGLRLSALKAGWDVSGFYYRSVDASPAFFRSVEMTPTPTLVFTPEHDKIHQLGATVAKDFGNILLKGEAIYTRDRWFNVDRESDIDGVVRQDTLDYILGLEHTFTDGALLNFQFFQRWYTDHDSGILFDELESGVSLYASKELSNRTEAELLMVTGLNRSDWMIRPKLTWDFATNWWFAVGADIFGGKTHGLFGRFDDSDRLYGQVRYAF